jgi:hypothetical protein
MTNPAAAHRALEWLSGEFFVVHRLDAVMVGTVVRSIEILAHWQTDDAGDRNLLTCLGGMQAAATRGGAGI